MYPSMKTGNGYLPGPIRTAAENLLAHGIISSLPFGKRLVPFKIFLNAKEPGEEAIPEFGIRIASIFALDCKLRGDVEASPYPLCRANAWSPLEISQLADTQFNQAVLDKYDIYWMAERDPDE